ncbi:arrestin domain-containing protein 3-like isoform X2 [Clinocottus analis]|uniref:arrestin domain-containing protein 3-like isoform X2 n=1 Tax=Clinocottus analis TaxID=304258 RepID=UPI0035C0349C
MPAIQKLTLTCDALNEYETFSEGDHLIGKVILALSKETTVESLFVKAKGDADVRWTKKSGDRTHTYQAHKRYFKLKQFLIPENSKVPQGIHVYKFHLKIPQGSMPSSFKGSHGKIVYKLEVKLSRSWKMDNKVAKDIRFVSRSFPNLHSLMSRQVGSTKKEMGLFSKGHVHMDVIVDKSAYAPGETLAIVAKINNSSSSEMIPKFSLIQNVVYRANSSTKHESSVIHKVVNNSIKSQTQKDVRCAIQIPRVQMPTIQNCDIISVEYHLKAYLDISFAFDPEIIFPVVIIPTDLAAGRQPGVAEGPYPAGAAGGPSNSDFPPPVLSLDPFPVSPHSGGYGHPGSQRYSAPPPVYQDTPPVYAGPSAFPPPPSAPSISPPSFSISPTAPTYNQLSSAPTMDTDFLSQSDEAPPAYSLLFPSADTHNSDAK